jgi:hypothetical protein
MPIKVWGKDLEKEMRDEEDKELASFAGCIGIGFDMVYVLPVHQRWPVTR